MKHMIFDIETIIDNPLVGHLIYPEENFSQPFGATHKYQQELLEQSQGKSDFIPHTFHLPVSLAFVATNDRFEIAHLGSCDRPQFRAHEITRQFWGMWKKYSCPQLVTFNGRGFDLPVMELCCYRYNYPNKEWFQQNGPSYTQPRNRFNSQAHFDLMEFFTNFGATRFNGGLNLAATLIGKPGKMDTKGSMVQELYEQGKLEAIDDYCLCDALDTYFVFLRSQVLLGAIEAKEESAIVKASHSYLKSRAQELKILEKYLDEFQFWKSPSEQEFGFYNTENFLKDK